MSTRFLVITLCLATLMAASVRGADAPKSADQAAWPPPHMKDLPADHLARVRHAIQNQLGDVSILKSVGGDVLKVRFGIVALALGQHVDEVNACFGADGFGWKPGKEFGFTLFSASYVRLYALFNDRTGSMKGRLSPKPRKT